ncbi:MAG: YggT family protein [Caldicoprobacterales bacterium]|nr:YggT family protein [Clostridiales bacterium]
MFGHSLLLRQLIVSLIWFINILSWAIIINSLLSWVLEPMHPVRVFLGRFIEPIVAPFRTLTRRLNTSGIPIDFSPLFAYITLSIIASILRGLL